MMIAAAVALLVTFALGICTGVVIAIDKNVRQHEKRVHNTNQLELPLAKTRYKGTKSK